MKITLVIFALLAAVAAFVFGRSTVDKGVSHDRVSALLREAGDSAVTEYKSSSELNDFVADALADTVEHYQAEVQAATRVVIRRVPFAVTDTLPVPVPEAAPSDTVTFALPVIDSMGVTVAESLTVHPPPLLLRRTALITFDPDTMVIALLRSPDGIQRFSAALNTPGSNVRVVDAAQLEPPKVTALQRTLQFASLASCVLAGYAAADDQLAVTLVSGAVCVTGGIAVHLKWW